MAAPAKKQHDDDILPERPQLSVIQGGGEGGGERANLKPADRHIYDNDYSPTAVTRPDLRVLEGGGETTDKTRGHLRDAGKATDDSIIDPGNLRESEETAGEGSAADDTIGSGFQKENQKNKLKNARTMGLPISRKGAGLGALILGGLAAIVVTLFLALIPFKIIHIVENVKDRFFATSNSAVDTWSDKQFSNYVKKHVLPGLGKPGCSSTLRNSSCADIPAGTGKLNALYRGWRDGNFEGKLASKYGIEFELDSRGGTPKYNLKVRGENTIDITSLTTSNTVELKDLTRGEVRQKMKTAISSESRWKQAMLRLKLGSFVERKYKIKRCVVACTSRDNFDEWRDNKKLAYKSFLSERVISPRSELAALFFECLTTIDCSNNQRDADGTDRDTFEREFAERLDTLYGRYGRERVDNLVNLAINLEKKGVSQVLLEKVITTLFKSAQKEAVEKGVGKAIPIVGWIDLVSNIVVKLNNSSKSFRKWAYYVGAASMVSYAAMYLSHADEIKNGRVNSDIVGSFNEALGTNTKNGENAEISPLYGEILGSGSPTTTSYIDRLLPSAYAQGTTAQTNIKQVTCDDGNTLGTDRLVCPEESLNTKGTFERVLSIFDRQPFDFLADIGYVWQETGGRILGAIGGIISHIPGVNSVLDATIGRLTSKFEQYLGEVVDIVANYVLPSPISDKMSGARSFNMIAGGVDVMGSDFAHYGLGGKQLSATEVADIRNEEEEKAMAQFAQLSLKERLLSTNNSRSLVSKIAISLPTDWHSGFGGFFSHIISSPFTATGRTVATISPQDRAFAQLPSEDPFGIIQYGYPVNDPVFQTDPDIYTPEYCAEYTRAWNSDVTYDENTGTAVHNRLNPCLLNDSTAGSLGALFSDETLDPGDINPGSTATTTRNPNTPPSDPTNCPSAPVDVSQVVNIGGVQVHTCIASNFERMLAAAAADGVSLAGSGWRDPQGQITLRRQNCGSTDYDIYQRPARECSPPTALPGSSMHERGTAVDFSGIGIAACPNQASYSQANPCTAPGNPTWDWLSRNAGTYGFRQLYSEAWHWSVTGT